MGGIKALVEVNSKLDGRALYYSTQAVTLTYTNYLYMRK